MEGGGGGGHGNKHLLGGQLDGRGGGAWKQTFIRGATGWKGGGMEVCCLLLWLSLCVSSASKNGHFLYASYVFFLYLTTLYYVWVLMLVVLVALSVYVCLLYKLGLLVQPCKELPIDDAVKQGLFIYSLSFCLSLCVCV